MDDVADSLRKVLKECNFRSDVEPSTPLGPGGLDLDSLSRLELSFGLQAAHGVNLTDEEIHSMVDLTFGDLVELVEARAGGEGSRP